MTPLSQSEQSRQPEQPEPSELAELANAHIHRRRLHSRAAVLLQAVFLVAMGIEGAACYVLLHTTPPTTQQWQLASLLPTSLRAFPVQAGIFPN
jgi:hypothetical protein